MASQFPCPESLFGCACELFPTRNFSQEEPDVPVFIGIFNTPPTTGTWFAPGCLSICESTVSQDEADECATRQAVECSLDNRIGDGSGQFINDFQSCTVECPDGTTFTDSVAAGTVRSGWQADADARAQALACKRALAKRLCFTTDTPLSNACVGDFASIVIGAIVGTSPYSFALTSGSLPAGLSLDSVGLITGTPTTSGTSTFTITVTDAIGSTQVKEFTLVVIEITSPASLPDATVNSAYSETLTSAGNSFPVTWAITSGALPTGLSMPATGVISGTPTVAGTYSFTATLTDFDQNSCSKDFTIEVVAVVALIAYWTFDDYVINSFILDSTANNHDISYNTIDGTILAGKIGNAFRPTNTATLGMSSGDLTQFNNLAATGFTLCGWLKLDPADATGDGNILNILSWLVPSSNVFLEILNADLLLNISDESFGSQTLTIANPQDAGWHFYRIWFDPSDQKMRFQLDLGTIQVSTAIPFASGTFSQLQFAGNAIFAGATLRYLDETGFWVRPLTDLEASDLWNGGAGITFGDPNMPP